MAEGSISTSDLHRMFWMVYWIVLVKKLYRMITFETTTMLSHLAMKLTMTERLILIETQTPVTIKITA